jgi:3-dehydroquinate synthase
MAQWATEPGLGTAALLFGLLTVDIILPVPSSLVMIASGSLLGIVWGSAVALAGSLGGQWLGYELARRYGQAAAVRLVGPGELDRMATLMARHGAVAVVVTRALPILLAALAGTAPIVIVYAWAGAVARDTGTLIPAVIILLGVAATGWMVTRRWTAC